jgi:hypothetical protein
MVDSVALLVDATEGVMAQTKFVLRKAIGRGLRPLVVLNKVDRESARPDAVTDELFDTMVAMGVRARRAPAAFLSKPARAPAVACAPFQARPEHARGPRARARATSHPCARRAPPARARACSAPLSPGRERARSSVRTLPSRLPPCARALCVCGWGCARA